MNRMVMGISALVFISSLASCSFFQRGTSKRVVIATNDSVKAILSNPLYNDSTKIALASQLLKGGPASGGAPTDTAMRSGVGIADGNLPPLGDTIGASSAEADALLAGLAPVWDDTITYSTFNGKAKVHYEGKDDKLDFTATIRMEKDKKIWVSIVALGLFEAVRAQITPDSIIVINRKDKEVRMLAFKDAGKLLPVAVDFGTLQRLLIGDALHVYGDRPSMAARLTDGFMMMISKDQYQQQLAYNMSDTSIRQQDLKVNGDTGATINMQYSDYAQHDNRRFAEGRVIDIKDATGNYHIEMNFNKAAFDEAVEFPFSVPSKYTRK